MSVAKIITLTNKGNAAGPYYEVSCSNDCVTYGSCVTTGSVYLPTIGSTATINIYDTTTCIKLVNYNTECNNSQVQTFAASGSTTSTTSTSTTTTSTTTTISPLTTNGLVSWLSCNSLTGSIWYDKSVNGNNALVSGSALTQSGSLGIAFNGTNNYLTYTQPITNQPSAIYTYQFYGTLPLTGANEWMFVNGNGSNRNGLIWSPTTSQFIWISTGPAYAITVSVASAEKAVWTILLDWNFGGFEIWKNNSFVGYITAGVYKFDNFGGFEFGYLQGTDATGTYFAGAAQDLIVYNRRLTNGEITTNYNYLTAQSCNYAPTTTTTAAPTTTTTTASTATLNWSYSITGGPTSNYMYLYINGSIVETRSSTSSGNYSVNLGDVIYVDLGASGCGGGSPKANAYTSGIISDASCANGTTTLSSYSYTVVSGDLGNVLHLDCFASCDYGCL